MKKIKTLIVPLVADITSPVFKHDDECMMNCVNALLSIGFCGFDEIYFVLNEDIANIYHLSKKISADLDAIKCNNYDFILLPQTKSPAETVYMAIDLLGWDDRSIYVKDGDNSFYIDAPMPENSIVCTTLEHQRCVDPYHKSYVTLDNQGFVTNCIERHVISNNFIAGAYSFRDARLYKEAYDSLKKHTDRFYISDIIYWLLLNKNEKFRPMMTQDFIDFNL